MLAHAVLVPALGKDTLLGWDAFSKPKACSDFSSSYTVSLGDQIDATVE